MSRATGINPRSSQQASKHSAYDRTGNRQGAFTKSDPRTTKAERRNKRKRTGR